MEKLCNQMKALSKIAILIGFIAFVSSCQKEDHMAPQGCPSHNNSVNERSSDPSNNQDPLPTGIKRGDEPETDGDVIGGGDDDRDGGGRKIKKDG
jgi:hypothetical protein